MHSQPRKATRPSTFRDQRNPFSRQLSRTKPANPREQKLREQRSYPPQSPTSANGHTRHNLAYWRGLAGDRERAVEEFAIAAQDAERALGADHPTTLTYRVNLAFWSGLAGDPATALADLAGLQPTVDKVLGADHPRALRTRQQRAELLELSGDRDAAITLLTALLADMIRVQGSGHPRTREIAESLAHCRDQASSPG